MLKLQSLEEKPLLGPFFSSLLLSSLLFFLAFLPPLPLFLFSFFLFYCCCFFSSSSFSPSLSVSVCLSLSLPIISSIYDLSIYLPISCWFCFFGEFWLLQLPNPHLSFPAYYTEFSKSQAPTTTTGPTQTQGAGKQMPTVFKNF